MQIAKPTLIGFVAIFLAVSVLLISIYRTTAIHYSFSGPNDSAKGVAFVAKTEYSLPFPGILPDHPLWPVKAARDRVWLALTWDPLERANRTLFLADKRLIAAKQLFIARDYDRAVATATKAENYLEKALVEGKDAQVKGKRTDGFFETTAKASLTHREVLEGVIVMDAPEDAKPVLIKTLDVPKRVYEQAVHKLNQQNKPVPPSN